MASGRVRVLGPLRVSGPDGGIHRGGPRRRLLLGLLATRPRRVAPSDWLVEHVWAGAPPPSARTALRVHLTHLRRTLAPISTCRLAGGTPGYVLEDDGLDSLEFERLVRSAADARQRGQPDAALPLLVEALGLWSGPAFDDLRGAAPVDDEAIRLERLRSDAAEEQIACLLDLGSPEQAIQPVAALRQAEPLRERPVELRCSVLYRVGRAPDALAAYQRARAELGELGLEPSPALRMLEGDVLRHEPTLLDLRAPVRYDAPVLMQSSAAPRGPALVRRREGTTIRRPRCDPHPHRYPNDLSAGDDPRAGGDRKDTARDLARVGGN